MGSARQIFHRTRIQKGESIGTLLEAEVEVVVVVAVLVVVVVVVAVLLVLHQKSLHHQHPRLPCLGMDSQHRLPRDRRKALDRVTAHLRCRTTH